MFAAAPYYTIRSDARKKSPLNRLSKTPKRLLSNASAFKVKRPCVLPKT